MRLSFFDIRSPLPQNWKELVTPLRQRHAEGFLKSEDRLRCLGAGILLARELGVSSDEQIVYNPWGKPGLRDKSAQFNLSHSGNLVVLAVSKSVVGVDIEQIRAIPFEREDMSRFLAQEEVSWLKKAKDANDFYRLWTGKEALMKATGRGLSLTPESFCALPLSDGAHALNGELWDMAWITMQDYMLCTVEQSG